MGPNGSGKSTLSHVLMGRPGYEVTGGSVTLDGVDLLAMATWERAQAGLFLAMQYPTEVPGVSVEDVLEAVRRRDATPAERRRPRVPRPGASASTSGSSAVTSTSTCPAARRSATRRCSSASSQPKIAILDELDSGLDVDALRVARAASRPPPPRPASACWPSPTTPGCSTS